MLSIKQAIKALNERVFLLPIMELSIGEVLDNVLAEDVYSPINMPPFRQSAMDGYAVCMENNQYAVIGEVKTGDQQDFSLEKGDAIRIFTGAMVPDQANAVVKQELVSRDEDLIDIEGPIKLGSNIRPMGEQIKKGELALKKGTKLNPAAIGFLATLGINKVTVFSKPRITVLITGNELVEPGNILLPGQIFESNATMLIAALEKVGYRDIRKLSIKDNFEETKSSIHHAIDESDVVLITGGISVGDYDFVGKALDVLQVEKIFYKVKQKPGKPLYCGIKDNCMIFALPGNPAAALSCFYVYVLGIVRQMCGEGQQTVFKEQLALDRDVVNHSGRGLFLKAIKRGNKVEILDSQSSAMLNTFALANVLVYIPSDKEFIYEGELVNAIPIL